MTNAAIDKIVFPLDVQDRESALKYTTMLKGYVGVFKIGLELFCKEGPDIINVVRGVSGGAKIFLDLKLHDIPETVKKAVRSINHYGVDYLTVHAEGVEMVRGAVMEAPDTCILGVTVLTSLGMEDLKDSGVETGNVADIVLKRAAILKKAGAGGLVCSPLEVGLIREKFGEDLTIVTPGIRPKSSEKGDQKRVMTPGEAIKMGSDLLVIGRPIRNAENPQKAARAIIAEIEQALK